MSRFGQADSASTPFKLLAIMLVGLNLRPFLTATGPLADEIRQASGLNLQGLSLLTLIPMVLMGLLAFAGPRLAAHFGARRVVLAALGCIAVASLLRVFAAEAGILLGTAVLLGGGAALIQAVFPGIMKRLFPTRVPAVTGLYSALLMGGGALGAQLAPVLAGRSGVWQVGLVWLAAPALLAIVAVACGLQRDQPVALEQGPLAALVGWPRAWLLMSCFGLVNGGYSSAVAWLAPAFQAAGVAHEASGGLLALMAICQAAGALILPLCAARDVDRRAWLGLALALQLAGFCGLTFWPGAAPLLWAAVLGFGLGGCFALMMVIALDQFRAPETANALAALMQGGGFIIAALPPFAVALLHDATGSYAAGWSMHLIVVGIVGLLTLRLSPIAVQGDRSR